MAGDTPTRDANDPGHPPALPPALPPEPVPAARPQPPERRTDAFGEVLALLQNRLILLGLGVVVVLLLITLVLVVLDGGNDTAPTDVIGPNTPVSDATVVPLEGLAGHMRSTAALWNGPGDTYAILGTVMKNSTVSVIGRSADGSWLQVVPPHSVRGWVDATFIDVRGDVSQLPIGGPGAGPSIAVPTSAFFHTPVPIATEPEVPTESVATPTESSRSTRTPPPTTTPTFAQQTNTPPRPSTTTPRP